MPVGLCRQNEDLELVSMTMQEEKSKLQQEATDLAQQLQAVLSDKYSHRRAFDAETPIDKTLGYLLSVIGVSTHLQQRTNTLLVYPLIRCAWGRHGHVATPMTLQSWRWDCSSSSLLPPHQVWICTSSNLVLVTEHRPC